MMDTNEFVDVEIRAKFSAPTVVIARNKDKKVTVKYMSDIFEYGDYGSMKITDLDFNRVFENVKISEGEHPHPQRYESYLSLEEANELANKYGFRIVLKE